MVCSDTPTNMAAAASSTPSGRPGRKDRLSHLRRQSVMESPSTNNDQIQDVSLQENDDERERNSRRQLRVLDDQEKNLSSPSTPSGRRLVLGTALSGLSNEELSEHYKECVRLSTENKITKKNAFQLHLIDYMADTIKKSGDDMNFQVASCALDASAKIYGYRVDALEADTCKLASELGRTHKTTENGDSQNSMGPENGLDMTKKKRKVRKSAKVEQNLKNITLDKIDRRTEVDSFRSQLSCGFDEQGVAGLFVFNLAIIDDQCQLALDSNSKPPLFDTLRDYDNRNTLNISTFKDILQKIRDEKPTVDQTFENFDFKQVDIDELSLENGSQSQPENNPEEFVYNQEMREAEEDYSNHGSDPLDVDMMDADDRASDTIVGAVSEKCKNPVLRLESINDTIGFLTAKPSEYSYYDPKLISAWAGPNHWRFLPHCRRPVAERNAQPLTKRKPKKTPSLIDFDAKPAEIVQNEAKNFLSKATLNKWSREKNELPFDHHYNIETLGKSMLNPALWVRSIKKVAKTIDADVGEGYNYDNPADKSNYCGADGDNNSDADDDFAPAASPIGGDFGGSQDMEFSFTQPQTDAQTQAVAFTGENLIQQPYKIDKPFLAYEKTAKKIDAKKIKKAMWTVLSNCEDEDKEVMKEPIMFTDLYKQIPKYISEAAAKNLSVPIAFVTFLHLCNEKVLRLNGEEEMRDFKIEQG